jgi:beta-glucanase (GH16 family)
MFRIAFVLAALVSAAAPAWSATAAKPDWRLVWSDDFNGDTLNPSCWYAEYNKRFNVAYELQNFTPRPENVSVSGGMLRLTARREKTSFDGRARDFTSAQVVSYGLADWTYGRFEARLRLPEGDGLWPAFWLYPTKGVYGGHPKSGEIDIAEFITRLPNRVWGVIHSQAPNGKHVVQAATHDHSAPLSADFHVYAAEWTPTRIRFYFDGRLFHETKPWPQMKGKPPTAPFDQPFFLLLNLSVGGDWAGPPNAKTTFPATFLVDWVRVYQDAALPAVKAREAKLRKSAAASPAGSIHRPKACS